MKPKGYYDIDRLEGIDLLKREDMTTMSQHLITAQENLSILMMKGQVGINPTLKEHDECCRLVREIEDELMMFQCISKESIEDIEE